MSSNKKSPGIREFLSRWEPWMVLAYIALTGVVLALYNINSHNSKVQTRIAKDEAIHESEIQSSANAAKASCLRSIPTLTEANRLVEGVKIFHVVLVTTSEKLLAATPHKDPLYKTRVATLKKLEKTIPLVSGLHFPVPTIKQCDALGRQPRN